MDTPLLSQNDKSNLTDRISKYLNKNNLTIPFSIKDWDDESWSVLLVCKLGDMTECNLAETIEDMFASFGIGEDDYIGYGFNEEYDGYIWVVTHPAIPSSVREKIDADIENEEIEEAMEIRKEFEENFRLPMPKKQKSTSDTAYLVLAREFYDDIKHGDKKVEYRELNQYYANKLLGKGSNLKFVLLQNGYGGRGHVEPEQMKFGIKEIVYVDDTLKEYPCYKEDGSLVLEDEFPDGYRPTMYGIKLGSRVEIA